MNTFPSVGFQVHWNLELWAACCPGSDCEPGSLPTKKGPRTEPTTVRRHAMPMCSVISDSAAAQRIFQARILEWFPFPPPENLPDPGIEPVSLALAG